MYLGLDIGTSGVKSLLIDAEQKIIGSSSASLTVSRPQVGWSEQNPDDWIWACEASISQLKHEYPSAFASIKGISLSGQMHGATLLDRHAKPLRPSILWNDTRSQAEAAELDAKAEFRAISGNIVFPGFTAPKLKWVENNEPDIFEKVAKVLLPKDYVRLWLTGEYVSDMSDASGTSWLSVSERAWSPTLLDRTSMRLDQMPALVEGTEVSGLLRVALANTWGLGPNVVVGGGAGDNAASAIGMGVINAGEGFVSLGTSGVIFAPTRSFQPNAASAVHAFCHALPKTWHQMGVILSASDSLNWYSKLVGQSAAALNDALPAQPSGPNRVRFLPYLSGERTPHNDANAPGVFCGLGQDSTTADLTQAVMEGVAFAFRDNLVALRIAGTEISELTAVGGGSRSEFWLKTLSNVLNIPIKKPSEGDFGAAFGAARLALIATEGMSPDKVLTAPAVDQLIEPDADLIDAYSDAYGEFKRLYPAIKRAMIS